LPSAAETWDCTPQQRETASEIFKTLEMSADLIEKQSVETLKSL
jgi:hypothetical protein